MSATATEALSRATANLSTRNYPAIYQGFMDKGIPEDQIIPRVNVFTFRAWKALGKNVRKGEHGVKVTTWVQRQSRTDPETGETIPGKRFPKTTTVFHVSQVD